MTDYLAPVLVQQGYVGSTAGTPYRIATAEQLATLQSLAGTNFNGQVTGTSGGTIHLNINFDGTKNNKDFVPIGG